ncbi:LysR family transcriptional regulator [Cupriavidus necator]|uniref:LysR family transcriptional regulator n=1 Tax=Cupriavidus necator TaxID=106590 RepID=A0A1U9UN46_CUPNE|nr:LysR family transcriptional regulator [Cupriavidus necator]AQV94154.1 LysR family transcriptional regulator [Cupriavidus necator]
MKDLNLLYVFEALWRDRSVTLAAENLGLTQAAVSSALKRLRTEYGDHLFMLVGRRMEPTPLASAIAGPLLDSLSTVRKTTGALMPFDPLNSRRQFTIRTRDVAEVLLLPAVLDALRSAAPECGIQTVYAPIEETVSALATGRIDVALGYLPSLERDIYKRVLFQQNYVCVMRSNHPLAAQAALTLDDFLAQDHLLVTYAGSGHILLERALIEAGTKSRIKLRMPQYLAAPHAILGSDLLWTAPQALANLMCQYYPLTARPLPLALEPFEVAVYWHQRFHKDPASVWFRNLLSDAVQRIPWPEGPAALQRRHHADT